MSADNWAYCPKCQPEGDVENEDLYRDHLLREGYEQGMSQGGKYCVYYKCSCQACGFSWEYRHEQQATTKST